MAIIKRGGDVYYVDFIYKKVRHQKSTGTTSLRKAREFEANMREKLRLGTYGLEEQEPPIGFMDFTEKFLTSVTTLGKIKPASIRFYKTKIAALLSYPPFRLSRIDQIHEGHIDQYKQWRLSKVSPGTVDLELATLRNLFSKAYQWKNLDRIPVVKKLNLSTPRNFILNDMQEQLYLAACPSPLRDIAFLLLHTGLRLGEALRLEWSDLSWENVPEGVGCWLQVREGKSQNARRRVPVPLQVAPMLRVRRQAANTADSLVFPSSSGKPYVTTSVDHLHSKVRQRLIESKDTKEAGFTTEFVLHSLRHTYLSRLGESGADGFAIMKIAGHGQITTSQRYVHPTGEHLARTVTKMYERLSATTVQPEWADSQVLPANLTASEVQNPVSY